MRSLLTVIVAFLCTSSLTAQEAIEYHRDVKPILKERCFACHGALKQKGKLRLDTADAMRRGGAGGAAVVAGQPDKSLLIERITSADDSERMPPEGKPLTPGQIAMLRKWIQQGAKAPAGEKAESDPRQHWAFKPPIRPTPPAVKNAAWVRNPIDAFVAARHEEKGLAPAPAADPATLLRRVHLDLIGLPPTHDELRAFLADTSPDAFEKVVDRLLASPRYAERWARHWMDIWRYSDWYGSRYINELRNSRRHIWRWRDWIIEAFEKDMPYDRMIQEILAADELAPADLNAQRATGYLGRNFYVFNRNVWLQDTVEFAASGLLGLTMKCARCHDHKYDPITQEEYYRLRAFFEPHRFRTDPIPGKTELLKQNQADKSPGANLQDGLDCVYDADLKEPTYLFARGNEKDPVKDHPLAPGVPAVLGGKLQIEAINLPLDAYHPHLRAEYVQELLREARAAVEKAKSAEGKDAAAKQKAAAVAKLAALEARVAAEKAKYDSKAGDAGKQSLAEAAAKAERESAVRQAEAEVGLAQQQLAKLQAEKKDAKALGAAQTKLTQAQSQLAQAQKNAQTKTSQYAPLGPVYPNTSSGRRLALARWIASRDNPLTARVAVNHLWLRHLGAALVPSVQNFGLNGKPPTHPELLDWLASEFMQPTAGGKSSPGVAWSFKHMHRLMVTSNTYRMASTDAAANVKLDPENRFLWRANVRRMEAEVVRDSLLHLAGQLDVTRGGADLDPALDAKIPRRSLFFRHTPDEKPLVLELFDAANPAECFERTESIVPQQALALANGDFCHSQARLMARKLDAALAKENSDGAFITAAFEMVLNRRPLPDERGPCEAFLKTHAAELGAGKPPTPDPNATISSAVPPSPEARLRARENLVHVLLNYNEFATIR